MEANTLELKGICLTNKGTSTSSFKPSKGHSMKRRRVITKTRLRRVRVSEGEDRGIETRVRTLKSLIPNNECKDLEGLFRNTAEYILGLQTRVRVMQMMVDALTNESHE